MHQQELRVRNAVHRNILYIFFVINALIKDSIGFVVNFLPGGFLGERRDRPPSL